MHIAIMSIVEFQVFHFSTSNITSLLQPKGYPCNHFNPNYPTHHDRFKQMRQLLP